MACSSHCVGHILPPHTEIHDSDEIPPQYLTHQNNTNMSQTRFTDSSVILDLNTGVAIRDVLPLKSSFFDWCAKYFKDPQMKVCLQVRINIYFGFIWSWIVANRSWWARYCSVQLSRMETTVQRSDNDCIHVLCAFTHIFFCLMTSPCQCISFKHFTHGSLVLLLSRLRWSSLLR